MKGPGRCGELAHRSCRKNATWAGGRKDMEATLALIGDDQPGSANHDASPVYADACIQNNRA